MSSYTYKMAIVSWPQILWCHFTRRIQQMTCHVHACQPCPMFWTPCINCHSVKIDTSITLLTMSYEHEDRYCLVNADKRRQFIDQCSLQITRQLLKIRHGQHAGWPSIHHPHPEHTHTVATHSTRCLLLTATLLYSRQSSTYRVPTQKSG